MGRAHMKFTNEWTHFNVPIWNQILIGLKGKPSLRFLEIGTYEGQSAIWFLENILTGSESTIDCVDPFYYPNPKGNTDKHTEIKGRFLDNTLTYREAGRLNLWESHSFEALNHFITLGQGKLLFDLIYIDGEHFAKNVLEDAVLSFRLLKPGGIMIFDDYGWDVHRSVWGKPKIGVDAFLQVYADKLELLHHDYQVIVKKLKD